MIDYTYLLRFLIGLATVLAYTYAAFEYTPIPETMLSMPEPTLMNGLGDYREVGLPPIPEAKEKPIPITQQHRKMPPIYKEFSHEELGEALKDIIAQEEEEEEECAPLKTTISQPVNDSLAEHATMWPIIEEYAKPVGGTKAFYAFIKKTMKYPKMRRISPEGKVFVSFIVKTDGSLRCIELVRGIHPELDAEALRIMQLSPKWIPATRYGQPIECRMFFPIHFHLR